MPVHSSVLDLIGDTPIVDVSVLSPNPSVRLLAKLEGQNPAGSVKDRIALAMVTEAEADGTLYDKRTPRVLRELAATHTFDRLLEAGVPVQPEEVLVAPYSALAMFDAILQSLNKLTPGGRLLCPAHERRTPIAP